MARPLKIGPKDALSRVPPDAVSLGGGFYQRPDGTAFLDAAEACVAQGLVPTRENQLKIGQMVQDQGDREGKPVLHREKAQ